VSRLVLHAGVPEQQQGRRQPPLHPRGAEAEAGAGGCPQRAAGVHGREARAAARHRCAACAAGRRLGWGPSAALHAQCAPVLFLNPLQIVHQCVGIAYLRRLVGHRLALECMVCRWPAAEGSLRHAHGEQVLPANMDEGSTLAPVSTAPKAALLPGPGPSHAQPPPLLQLESVRGVRMRGCWAGFMCIKAARRRCPPLTSKHHSLTRKCLPCHDGCGRPGSCAE
jgi:hypothetical protein